MTALPVLLRECRVEARRKINHWLRLLSAAVMVFVFMGFVARDSHSAALLGARAFPSFHAILFVAAWIIAPLLAADCLAQEKREGTLQLLMLTRLTWGGVVAAKLIVHALRGFAILLAALPVLTLPFLLGGVSPAETRIAILLSLSAMTLGLAAGILASAVAQSWARATALALTLGFLTALVFAGGYYWGFHRWIAPLAAGPGELNAWQLLLNHDGCWGKTLARLPPSGEAAWVALVKVIFISSGLLAVLLVQFSGWEIRHGWVGRLASRMESGALKFGWARWLGKSPSRTQRRRQLRHNPIFWLQQRTWSARATKWAWCGAVLLAEALLMTLPMEEVRQTGQKLIGLALILGVIYAAASSYRLEKRNGMLELILVTPLSPWKLVSGRTWSLWRQFLPAYFAWTVFAFGFLPFDESLLQMVWFAFTVLLVAPVAGLDCAVNLRGHWRAVLATTAAVLLVPGTVFLYGLSYGWGATCLSCLVLWIVGMLTTAALELQMKERRFRYLHPHVVRLRRSRHRKHRKGTNLLFEPVQRPGLQT